MTVRFGTNSGSIAKSVNQSIAGDACVPVLTDTTLPSIQRWGNAANEGNVVTISSQLTGIDTVIWLSVTNTMTALFNVYFVISPVNDLASAYSVTTYVASGGTATFQVPANWYVWFGTDDPSGGNASGAQTFTIRNVSDGNVIISTFTLEIFPPPP